MTCDLICVQYTNPATDVFAPSSFVKSNVVNGAADDTAIPERNTVNIKARYSFFDQINDNE